MIGFAAAIATMKDEIMQCKNSNPEPILEEFMPLKKSSPDEKDEKTDDVKETDIVNRREKMNWMSSVQLWNSDSNNKKVTEVATDCYFIHKFILCSRIIDLYIWISLFLDEQRKEEAVDRPSIDELFRSGKNRAVGKVFSPSKGCSNFPAMTIGKEARDEFPGAPSLSLRTPEIKNSTEDIFRSGFSSKSSSTRSGSSCGTNSQSSFKAESQQTGRKQRRCWSPELHRRFVCALQQLGGAQGSNLIDKLAMFFEILDELLLR